MKPLQLALQLRNGKGKTTEFVRRAYERGNTRAARAIARIANRNRKGASK